MSIKLADTLAPMGDFPAVESDNVDITIDGSPKSLQQAYEDGDLGGGGSSIQVETMPAASAENVGKIVQYVGETGSYEHGCFYECKDESGSYVWRYISTVKNGVFYTNDNIIDSTLYPVGSVAVYTGEPLWGLFKGHHYEYVEDTTLTTYKFNGTKNGETLSFFLANKELEVGSALVRISDGYIVSYVSAVNGTTITVQGRTYTETFTDVVETGETEEVASYTGWIDIGGGGSDGGEEGTSIFYGTMDEWDALSTDAKKQYDYMADDNAGGSYIDTYSTNEVKTNKVWIDDKPIYRIVVTATAGAGPSSWGWAISQADFNSIGIDNITFAGIVADGLQFMPVGVNKSNGFFPMVGMILTGQRIVLEYTKTTD